MYNGGTIFVDAATSFTKVFHQTSLRAGDTLRSKHAFDRIAREHGITIKKYHGNNGIFQSSDWIRDCELEEHGYEFSGVGAQHQSGVAKRTIGTINRWFTLHDLSLCFALAFSSLFFFMVFYHDLCHMVL